MPDPETNIVERATKECEQIFERMRQNCEQALEIIRDIYLDDLKAECFPLSNCFHSKAHARRTIFEYIEVYYNNQRLHSGLGHKSPRQYESRYQPEKGATFSKEKVTATLCAEGGAEGQASKRNKRREARREAPFMSACDLDRSVTFCL